MGGIALWQSDVGWFGAEVLAALDGIGARVASENRHNGGDLTAQHRRVRTAGWSGRLAARKSARAMDGAMAFAVTMGVVPEQLEWSRGQGWLHQAAALRRNSW